MSDSAKEDYESLCPPAEVYQYFFTVYPLDAEEFFSINKKNFLDQIRGHIIDSAQLIGK